MQKTLYPWQEDCLHCWLDNGGRGIVNVVTGAGKTVLALAVIERLQETLSDLRVYIVVPKTFLAAQWARALREDLAVERGDIGIFSGTRKDPPGRIFTIYVVNSARYGIARRIVTDMRADRPVLLIADECHHYGTDENARIFGFKDFIPRPELYYALGLSATPYTARFNSVLVPALGAEIYHFGFENALYAGIINPFVVFNIALYFHPDERDEYERYTESLRIMLKRLKECLPHLRGLQGGAFFAQLRAAMASSEAETAELARNTMLLLYRRKDVIYHARERIACVTDVVSLLRDTARVIIFAERIETTELIYHRLKQGLKRGLKRNLKDRIGLYHSEMDEGMRTIALRRFEDGEIRVLVSCKALDEGFNVPEADVGIIVSSTNSDRQRIQRMGRVLRKKGGGESGEYHESCLYYLYVEDSAEEMTLLHVLSEGLAGIPVVDMTYSEMNGFISPQYDELAEAALGDIRRRGWRTEQIQEAARNINLGRVSCEWLLDEDECRRRSARAETRAEKNYYVTMGLLAKARGEWGLAGEEDGGGEGGDTVDIPAEGDW